MLFDLKHAKKKRYNDCVFDDISQICSNAVLGSQIDQKRYCK